MVEGKKREIPHWPLVSERFFLVLTQIFGIFECPEMGLGSFGIPGVAR